MRASRTLIVAPLAAALALSGCLGTGEDRVLSIESTGTVQGFVFFDRDGNGEFDDGDDVVAGIQVGLASLGSIIPIFRATSDADGLFTIQRIDVASYEVRVDSASAGDSVQIVVTDPESFTLSPDDTTSILIGVSFPKPTVQEARALPAGQTVFVEGIALNDRETFGDNTVHLHGAAAAIRVTGVTSGTISAGDSLRFLGTTSTLDGQPTLDDATAVPIASASVPPPDSVSAAEAASADGGALDAALVRVDSVTVSDTATVSGGFQLTVDDASSTLIVLLDADAPITDPAQYVPGTAIDVTGLLVPDGGAGAGGWLLKPRSGGDLTIR